jgi:hypothetical protein
MGDRSHNFDELFNDDGEPVCDGDTVEANGTYIGNVPISEEGKFRIEGWPDDAIIHSLEVV